MVLSSYRGQGLGKGLMEYLIYHARENLGGIDLHLTSHPTGVAANECIVSVSWI